MTLSAADSTASSAESAALTGLDGTRHLARRLAMADQALREPDAGDHGQNREIRVSDAQIL